MTIASATSWVSDNASSKVNCLCLGTGRFLRSVLVPILNDAGFHVALIQPRGTSFLKYMFHQQNASKQFENASTFYEVDTVLTTGDVHTDQVECHGVFSLGTPECRQQTWEFVASLEQDILIIGVGVTEAGLESPNTTAMQDLAELLGVISKRHCQLDRSSKICIVDMDNVSENGNVIQSHLQAIASRNNEHSEYSLLAFLIDHVVCLNTMVDRITSSRQGDPFVPRAEPFPAKSLVIFDPDDNLPTTLHQIKDKGVIIRSTRQQLDADIALKLRIANGTHTAIAHAMALQGILTTEALGKEPFRELWIESYLESLVQNQIIPVCASEIVNAEDCWKDWKTRLAHPYFGLSSFFITQNGAAKAGIRWSGTVIDLVSQKRPITVGMVFAYAALIRWLIPQHSKGNGIFVGWLDGAAKTQEIQGGVDYADRMRYNLEDGWYEFKCACAVDGKSFSERWMNVSNLHPSNFYEDIKEYLCAPNGGSLACLADTKELDVLVQGTAALVARMVSGETVKGIMLEMHFRQGLYANGFSTDGSVLSFVAPEVGHIQA